MNLSSVDKKTLFREEAEEYQFEQKRTKSAGLKISAFWSGGGAILLAFGLYLATLPEGDVPTVLICMVPIGLAMMLYGLYGIFSSLIRGTKEVTCPNCQTKHAIFRKEHHYMCTECGTLLNMGTETEPSIEWIDCAYCGHQAAVSKDYGAYTCHNCGVKHRDADLGVRDWTAKCPNCQEVIPNEALYCINCEYILKPLPSYDMDWKIGKDAYGHYHFARMLLAAFPRKEVDLAAKMVKPASQSPWSEILSEVRTLLETLGELLRSLEVALQESELHTSVQKLSPWVDFLYARLLVLELSVFEWAQGPEKSKLKIRSYGNFFETFEKGPHIRARKRFENILGLETIRSAGGIGAWDDGMLVVSISETDATDPTKPTTFELVGYSSLEDEALRFAQWAVKNGFESALLDDFFERLEKAKQTEKELKKIETAASTVGSIPSTQHEGTVYMPATASEGDSIQPIKLKPVRVSKKSNRKVGWVITIFGIIFLVVGMFAFTPIILQLTNPEGVSYGKYEAIQAALLCSVPLLVIGLGTTVLGIIIIRRSRLSNNIIEN